MKARKYRSRDGSTIRVVTNTGHITLVGADWKELAPIYHQAAMNAGCECDDRTATNAGTKSLASSSAEQSSEPAVLIEKALKAMLERDVEGDFNGQGQPDLVALKKLAGINVKRAQVTPIYERLVKEAEEGESGAGAGGDEEE